MFSVLDFFLFFLRSAKLLRQERPENLEVVIAMTCFVLPLATGPASFMLQVSKESLFMQSYNYRAIVKL